jgi:hypothetical protein
MHRPNRRWVFFISKQDFGVGWKRRGTTASNVVKYDMYRSTISGGYYGHLGGSHRWGDLYRSERAIGHDLLLRCDCCEPSGTGESVFE